MPPLVLSYEERLGPADTVEDDWVVLRPGRGLNIVASSSGVAHTCRIACVAMPSGLRLVSVAKSVPERNRSHSTAWIGSKAGCDAI